MNDKLNHSTLLLINVLSESLLIDPSQDKQKLLAKALKEVKAVHSLTDDELTALRRKADSFYNLLNSRPDRSESIVKMATGAIHDFNNTLTIIMGYSELLSEEGLDTKYRFYLDEIINATRRGSLLTKQILGFSHRKPKKPEVVQISNLINSLQKMVKRVIGEDITIEYKLSPQACPVEVDIALLEQAFIDLIFTACDSMPQGGKLLVEYGSEQLPEGCRGFIRISQDGEPMAKEALDKVAALIEESRGTMEVNKEASVTKLSFPQAEMRAQPEPAKGQETILLLEGSPETARFLTKGLEGAGYHLITAPNKDELINLLEKSDKKIALMITDLLMPTLEGVELLKRLNKALPSMKLLFITDDIDRLVAHYGIAPEKSHIIQKPFTLKSLKNRIRTILD